MGEGAARLGIATSNVPSYLWTLQETASGTPFLPIWRCAPNSAGALGTSSVRSGAARGPRRRRGWRAGNRRPRAGSAGAEPGRAELQTLL